MSHKQQEDIGDITAALDFFWGVYRKWILTVSESVTNFVTFRATKACIVRWRFPATSWSFAHDHPSCIPNLAYGS